MYLNYFFFSCHADHPHLHSFPTRRSSDLHRRRRGRQVEGLPGRGEGGHRAFLHGPAEREGAFLTDRKSTRLNSSHVAISYAVFCLKKKKTTLPELNVTVLTYTVEEVALRH